MGLNRKKGQQPATKPRNGAAWAAVPALSAHCHPPNTNRPGERKLVRADLPSPARLWGRPDMQCSAGPNASGLGLGSFASCLSQSPPPPPMHGQHQPYPWGIKALLSLHPNLHSSVTHPTAPGGSSRRRQCPCRMPASPPPGPPPKTNHDTMMSSITATAINHPITSPSTTPSSATAGNHPITRHPSTLWIVP